ncbi:hypothetical protein PV387_03380 [Streptomyces sp. ME02-6987-2C]|uniref:hypothetical protein n=1 Tax=unclassified Streptomyces TaxID=2593676 RepID=UPI0029B61F57|nr:MULTISPECIES: hypothetical protein [unclassified Streptomyces]MDX3345881.1 hypothetical protein [Streptomyces sp. ME02-6979A]MDX3365076.1 hypothetical protein [Streptomyces sp. ME02-6987-2C]MDX3404869.1 hypothetical protein [Streptomyces sp. ME02-6977A]MDX3421647.1 hypothetical protein [Streptomyces sp. ME02-6985-2c]
MAACCGVPRCSCRVVAGPGITVEGNGSASTPYVVSGESGTTAVQAADTPSVDVTVSGTGTTDDPYEVSAAVILDPAPPGGGSNLVHAGPDGVYVECADVRGCLSAGDGIAYDPASGEIAARPSTDAGNTVTFGSDGGLYSADGGAGTPTAVEGGTTPTATTTVGGAGTAGDPFLVTTAVILDPAPPGGGSNLVHAGPDGVYVECADVRGCLSAGDGITYDPASGEIAAQPTVVQAGTGTTVTGTGTTADPYEVSAAPQETACGLTGDGSAAAPLAAAVVAWPYPCDVDANAGGVYCDSTGQLRAEPRGTARYLSDQQVLNPADLTVPAAEDTEVAVHTLTIDNPDPCREAFAIIEAEVDADFNLPPGAGAALGILTDEMSYLRNSGSSAILDTHIQGTKVVSFGSDPGQLIPPGGSMDFVLSIRMGRGSGGATYNRIQSFARAFVFVL